MRKTNIIDLNVADTTPGADCVFAPSKRFSGDEDAYRNGLWNLLNKGAVRHDIAAYARWIASGRSTTFTGPFAEAARAELPKLDAECLNRADAQTHQARKEAARLEQEQAEIERERKRVEEQELRDKALAERAQAARDRASQARQPAAEVDDFAELGLF